MKINLVLSLKLNGTHDIIYVFLSHKYIDRITIEKTVNEMDCYNPDQASTKKYYREQNTMFCVIVAYTDR